MAKWRAARRLARAYHRPMAEIRKHNPRASSDIGEQVRALMGETIRPVEPGLHRAPTPPTDLEGDPTYDPFDQGESPGAVTHEFSAAGEPTIGLVPGEFISWADDEEA